MILIILFWISVFLIFHTYVLYPLIIQIISKGKKENNKVYTLTDKLPFISVIMSVHNEELVLVEKIKSLYYTSYPFDKFEVLIGSDASTDGTNKICQIYSENYQGFRFYNFNKRRGKPAVINNLFDEAKGDIIIMTDANVFFDMSTLFELVKHFANPEISIVGGSISNGETQKAGISFQESAFLSRELKMKYQEGLIWGKTLGVEGALYAIKRKDFSKVPDNFSVDDFYITMKVLSQNKKVIMNPKAWGIEDIRENIKTEFRRKVRISAGNWQNLRSFFHLLWPPWSSLSFAFFSHKVIRWTGPFLLFLALISSFFLAISSPLYFYLLLFQLFLLIIPLIDYFLRFFKIHIIFLRFVTHFYAMNAALLIGFFKFLFGIKTNVWQPTPRNYGEKD